MTTKLVHDFASAAHQVAGFKLADEDAGDDWITLPASNTFRRLVPVFQEQSMIAKPLRNLTSGRFPSGNENESIALHVRALASKYNDMAVSPTNATGCATLGVV